jgi:hypothetical protein
MRATNDQSVLSPADLLVRGLQLGPLDEPPVPVPPGTVSCISGQPLTEGYPARDMFTGTLSESMDLCHGNPDGWVSANEAITWRNNDPRQGMKPSRQCLIFEDDSYYYPLINLASAKKAKRPCWRDLVREVWPTRKGERMLMLLSDAPHKRMWPAAVVGELGSRSPVYVYNGDVARTLYLDWPAFIECLDLVEAVYALGFSKEGIGEGLLSNYNVAKGVGFGEALRLDWELGAWRSRPEFTVGLILAQREG